MSSTRGSGPRAWEDVLETSGEYIDIVKLGWGTAWVTGNLSRKLEVLRGKPVVIGGTFFEVVYARDRLDEYKRWLQGSASSTSRSRTARSTSPVSASWS